MERVENSARLMDVYSAMLFDLPRGSYIGWEILLDISGANEQYQINHSSISETSVVKFLLADTNNSNSIFSCLKMLRENARTTREVIPAEAWEQINELYLNVKDTINSGIARKNRRELFQVMIEDCQRLGGLLSGSMAHNTAYSFIQLGRRLERADMTTRIVDVGSISLLPAFAEFRREGAFLETFENVVWMNILRSLSAYQAYRQSVHNRVNGEDVVRYLLQNEEFPRSVNFCLNDVNRFLEDLPNHEDVQRAVVRVKRITGESDVKALLDKGLLDFIDELQISIADIHDELSRTWFGPVDHEDQEVEVPAPVKAKEKAKKAPAKLKSKAKDKSKAKTKASAKAKPKAKTKAKATTKSKAKPKTKTKVKKK